MAPRRQRRTTEPQIEIDDLARVGELSFRERVYAYVRRIPRGHVTTYGAVAAELGSPRAARVVGAALHALPAGTVVPWQRVINAAGRISIKQPDHALRQAQLLTEEGVAFGPDGATDLQQFGWPASAYRPKLQRRSGRADSTSEHAD